jgi:hypothetical protein
MRAGIDLALVPSFDLRRDRIAYRNRGAMKKSGSFSPGSPIWLRDLPCGNEWGGEKAGGFFSVLGEIVFHDTEANWRKWVKRSCRMTETVCKSSPHPSPLPEYEEREEDEKAPLASHPSPLASRVATYVENEAHTKTGGR